jgi:hypothetical protein
MSKKNKHKNHNNDHGHHPSQLRPQEPGDEVRNILSPQIAERVVQKVENKHNPLLLSSHEQQWFRARNYGWGWTPNTWQGWAVLLVWAVFFIWNTLRISAITDANRIELPVLIVEQILSVLILLWVAYLKGGPPRWRWRWGRGK